MSVDTVSEKAGIDYTAFFHVLRHTYVRDVTKKMKYVCRRDVDNEILATTDAELGWTAYGPKAAVSQQSHHPSLKPGSHDKSRTDRIQVYF